MPYRVEVIADSISPQAVRLTTLSVTLPRIVLAELNTHRMLSRNSASSRAIPIQRMIDKVMQDPFIPFYWGANQKGMQAAVEIDPTSREEAERDWLHGRNLMIQQVSKLSNRNVHKQLANRLLEPWLYTTVLVSATDWDNFFALRCHPDAQPELRRAAEMMRDAMAASTPRRLAHGEWHVPYARGEDRAVAATALDGVKGLWAKDLATDYARLLLSAARCARVSYDASSSVREQVDDIALAKRLASSGHWSPFEHIATPSRRLGYTGNFWGWRQLRWFHSGESGQV